MSACMLDHPRCVQYLLDNGADANLMDAHRMPALFYAVAESSVNCVRMLCERGAYAEHLDDDGNPNNLYLLRYSISNFIYADSILTDRLLNFVAHLKLYLTNVDFQSNRHRRRNVSAGAFAARGLHNHPRNCPPPGQGHPH